MNRTLRALSALVLLAVVLVGVPLLLVVVGRLDGLVSLRQALTVPDDGRLLLGVLTLVAWLAWLVVALTIMFEAVDLMTRGQVRIRLPGTGWLRPAAASLVIAVSALVLAPHAPMTHHAPAQPVPIETTDVGGHAVVEAVVDDEVAVLRHTVVAGDDLWSLATSYLGDGAQWRLIAEANPWLDPAAHLEAGSVLKIPVDASVQPMPRARLDEPASHQSPVLQPTDGQATAKQRSVVVAKGDSLWSIAKQHLGDPERWPEIYDLNRDQIDNPDEIDIGWVLALPAESDQPPVAAQPPTPASQAEAPSVDVPNDPEAQQPAPPVAPPDVPAATPTAEPTGETVTRAAETQSVDLALVSATGGALAFGLLSVLARYRVRQLRQRGLGRRIPPVDEANRRLEQALGQRAVRGEPHDRMGPTEVVLGWSTEGTAVTTDLERNGVTVLAGELDDVAGAVAAISSSLLCSDWSDGVEQHLVGRHDCWAGQIDDPTVFTHVAIEDGLTRLDQVVAARRAALLGEDLASLRADPDLTAVWQPIVFLFCQPLNAAERARIEAACVDEVGVSAVLPGDEGEHIVHYGERRASLGERTFEPQLISSPARHVLIELFRAAASDDTMPAPWWSDDDLPPNVTPLRRAGEPSEEHPMDLFYAASSRHPTLLLLGPVELSQAAGQPPARAVKQCEEYCAWLLAHPGRTATVMAADLLVAEPTRRSNMSRLRTWLGDDPQGNPYLPDAYSGRIQLHPEVTSDWEHFCAITAGGINRATAGALRQALELVRGAPLADRAPWQWQWAEGLRTDMVSAIRDAGVVLAELAFAADDIDLARWAVTRASAAAPDDELLLAALARVEHHCGNGDEVKRIIMQLTRTARLTGVDLQERTVGMLQEVLEGRRRAREV